MLLSHLAVASVSPAVECTFQFSASLVCARQLRSFLNSTCGFYVAAPGYSSGLWVSLLLLFSSHFVLPSPVHFPGSGLRSRWNERD